MKKPLLVTTVILVSSAGLAACGRAPSAPSRPGIQAAPSAAFARDLSVAVRLEIRAAGIRTQAVVTPYTGADVDHLVIAVMDPQGNTQASLTVPQAQIGRVLTLTNLAPDTTYTIACRAYDASGDLVSVDAQSQTTLAVGNDDVLAPITLDVQLQDKVFNGVATGAISVADGTVLPPDQPVAITVLVPSPAP